MGLYPLIGILSLLYVNVNIFLISPSDIYVLIFLHDTVSAASIIRIIFYIYDWKYSKKAAAKHCFAAASAVFDASFL
jgi:hypothetical protein